MISNELNSSVAQGKEVKKDTRYYIRLLHDALNQDLPSFKEINKIIEEAEEYKRQKKADNVANGICKIVNSQLDSKNTPLHNIKDNNGETVLCIALKNPNSKEKIINLLLEKDADPNIKDNNGETVLCIALKNPNPKEEIINLLLEKGADSNIKDNNGETALCIALKNPNPKEEIIKLLLEKGADPNIKDNNGETALCLAIKNLKLWDELPQKVKDSLIEKSEIKKPGGYTKEYRYRGPLNDKKGMVNKDGDNYLHIAARAGNKDAFLSIYEKDITLIVHHNSRSSLCNDHNNPFHEAAQSGILYNVVNDIMQRLDTKMKGNEKIKKTEKDQYRKVLNILKEEKKYIKSALTGEKHALNVSGDTPLDCLSSPSEKKEIKKLIGIEDKFIYNKKFHLCLKVLITIWLITAVCIALYFLYLASPPFALSTVVTHLVGGATFFTVKICDGLHELLSDTSLECLNVEPAINQPLSY